MRGRGEAAEAEEEEAKKQECPPWWWWSSSWLHWLAAVCAWMGLCGGW